MMLQIRKDNPNWTAAQVTEELGKRWKDTTKTGRMAYERVAAKDNLRAANGEGGFPLLTTDCFMLNTITSLY